MESPIVNLCPPIVGCGAPLGVEDGRIPKSSMLASSMWDARHGPWRGRLNMQIVRGSYGAWCARYNNVFQWLQVNLGYLSRVVAVATQGRYGNKQWVRKYELSYSFGGNKFKFYSIKGKVKVCSWVQLALCREKGNGKIALLKGRLTHNS